jgi:hypothetical protein
MGIGQLFWLLIILWIIFWSIWTFTPNVVGNYGPHGSNILILVLFVLLGWHAFGPILR